MIRASSRWSAGIALALAFASVGISQAEEKAALGLTLGVRMRELLAALEQLLPAALSEERFAEPDRRAEIESSLAKLAQGADRVAAHGKGRDASFAFLSETLADEARRIHRRFEAGKFDEARFLLLELTEGCVACHSRLPSRSSHLSDRLLANPALRELDTEERAKLEFTTRQFDRAIASYEKLFSDPARDPDDLELSGRIDEYLELAIHVENQPERARRALQPIAKRSDASESLRGSLAKWDAALADLAAAHAPASLTRAQELIRKAEAVSEKGWDRPGLVYYIAASGVLHRVLEDPKLAVVDQANAHYWLGLVESRVGRSFWLSQTSALLERSIRLAPGGPHARDALDLLRSFEVASHTGADNEEADGWNWNELVELDGLIRDAHK
jgi:hypothetical protein